MSHFMKFFLGILFLVSLGGSPLPAVAVDCETVPDIVGWWELDYTYFCMGGTFVYPKLPYQIYLSPEGIKLGFRDDEFTNSCNYWLGCNEADSYWIICYDFPEEWEYIAVYGEPGQRRLEFHNYMADPTIQYFTECNPIVPDEKTSFGEVKALFR